MTITTEAPANLTSNASNVSNVNIRPETIFEVRSILRHSSNLKNGSARTIHLNDALLEGKPVLEVTGSATSHPISIFVSSGSCTLKLVAGEILVENISEGNVEVVYA